MAERILIGVAWPYANGPLHVGHVAGCYLGADIFARFQRAKGNEVLMVSGSDMHGTPITVQAEAEGISAEQLASRVHQGFLDTWKRLGISFSLFTTTHTDNHIEIAQAIFTKLLNQGDIYAATEDAVYCPNDRRFLPDRYVEGTCPHCGYVRARGDQCENCGRQLNPTDLIGMRCKICGTTPEVRATEHFFLRLTAFNQELLAWMKQGKDHWRTNVRNFTIAYLEEGLIDRAITRDIEWGVPIPLPGYDQKRIYVWFEAVIGYLSASVEWSKDTGDPEAWRRWWQDEAARTYYFIGKDNIPFHSIIWPAILSGYRKDSEYFNLPYDVPANEFMNLEGRKISTSQGWAVWVLDYLSRYDADPLRYYLAAAMPETNDGDFSWSDFLTRNNSELVATFGNLVHRVLTFTTRNFANQVPEPGPLSEADGVLLARIQRAFVAADAALDACRFRDGLREAMALAQETNRYLDEQAPWKAIREDRQSAGRSLYVAIQAISSLGVLFGPFLPFSATKLDRLLGFGPDQAAGTAFRPRSVPAGQRLPAPEALFQKLDDAIVEQEQARLKAP